MPDVVDVIMNDHREVERLFDKLRQRDGREQTVPVLVTLLTAHSRAEEAEVYPVARDEAGAADKVAHSQEEHAEADRLLEELAAADPESPEFDEVLAKVVEAVTHHIEEEEKTVLPAMQTGLGDERRAELADAFLANRREHLGDMPDDVTAQERQVQAANAGIEGRTGMSKDEVEKELLKRAEESKAEEEGGSGSSSGAA